MEMSQGNSVFLSYTNKNGGKEDKTVPIRRLASAEGGRV
jgi:hypothetical protein